MIPAPVWKSSYRLIFSDKPEPMLEGWAIIDNTTGEDWTNVLLSVVSGRPVSFISKLYEPKYVLRQTFDLPDDQAAAPKVYGGCDRRVGRSTGHRSRYRRSAEIHAASCRTAGTKNEALEVLSSAAINVASADLGELFEYRFSTPVTVKKDESAMLPFLQQTLGARKLLIYSENYGEHPMNAAELTNSTGKTLDGGPITVFDTGSYAGEALDDNSEGR